MHYILASSDPIPGLASWGQAAAIVLLLYFLIVTLVGLALTLGLMVGFSWVRQKAELIKKLRPTVNSVNMTMESASKGSLPPAGEHDNKVVRSVAEASVRVHDVEEKIEQVSDRVANAVIEFRARTLMVQGTVKAFFLPGLTKHGAQATIEQEGAGYRILMEQKAPQGPGAPGDGYAGNVTASQLKGAPVQVDTRSK